MIYIIGSVLYHKDKESIASLIHRFHRIYTKMSCYDNKRLKANLIRLIYKVKGRI